MTDAPPPILFAWDGDAMVPAGSHWIRQANKHFVVGQRYPLEVREERSSQSHAHYFACINDAWQNLPESLAERFPTPDHLRKWALIRCGYADERSVVCGSKAEAQRVAAFIKPMDEFAVVMAKDAVVTVWTAKSQSMKAQGKKAFQESKDKVLDFVASLIGTTRDELAKNASEAA